MGLTRSATSATMASARRLFPSDHLRAATKLIESGLNNERCRNESDSKRAERKAKVDWHVSCLGEASREILADAYRLLFGVDIGDNGDGVGGDGVGGDGVGGDGVGGDGDDHGDHGDGDGVDGDDNGRAERDLLHRDLSAAIDEHMHADARAFANAKRARSLDFDERVEAMLRCLAPFLSPAEAQQLRHALLDGEASLATLADPTLKRATKRFMLENHPDKQAGRGAAARTTEFNAAKDDVAFGLDYSPDADADALRLAHDRLEAVHARVLAFLAS